MKRECAWCGKSLGETPDTRNVITHGICAECAEKLIAEENAEALHEFLERLGVPIMMVDGTGIVRTANTQCRVLLGKDLDQIEGYRGGDVMECTFASLPGGCGKTEHCKACTIRNTVMDSHASGTSHQNVIAYQNINGPDGVQRMWFRISTEKIGQIVLLRIDDVGSESAA